MQTDGWLSLRKTLGYHNDCYYYPDHCLCCYYHFCPYILLVGYSLKSMYKQLTTDDTHLYCLHCITFFFYTQYNKNPSQTYMYESQQTSFQRMHEPVHKLNNIPAERLQFAEQRQQKSSVNSLPVSIHCFKDGTFPQQHFDTCE